MGFELLQQDVGWDLEKNIGYEEDDKSIAEFCSVETELGRKTKHVCVGNVDSIQES